MINKDILKLRANLVKTRLKIKTGVLKDTSLVKKTKKEIARLLTKINATK